MAGEWGLHPVMADRVRRYCGACGLTVTSGGRSRQRQAELYACWRARRPGCAPANPPGSSNHEDISGQGALAADLGPRDRIRSSGVRARAREFGLHFPIAGEPWHVQPVECRSAKWAGNCLGGPSPASGDVPPFPGLTRRGSRGNAVRAVQQRLADRGWRIAVDGDFGPRTDTVVRAYQREKGLAVDGVVGPMTWRSMWTAPR